MSEEEKREAPNWNHRVIGAVLIAGIVFVVLRVLLSAWELSLSAQIGVSSFFGMIYLILGRRVLDWLGRILRWL